MTIWGIYVGPTLAAVIIIDRPTPYEKLISRISLNRINKLIVLFKFIEGHFTTPLLSSIEPSNQGVL